MLVDYTQVHVSRIYRNANKGKGTWARVVVVFSPLEAPLYLLVLFFPSWLFSVPLTVSLKNIFLSPFSLTLLKT